MGNPEQTFCVICKSKKGKVKIFNQNTLDKCMKILKIRKKFNFKFHDVRLPSVLSSIEGYHTRCYCNFTAVKRSKTEEGSAKSKSASVR